MLLTTSMGAKHIIMNKVDKQGNANIILPANTADDVICDENSNTLSEYLCTVSTSETVVGAPMFAMPYGSGLTLNAATLSALTKTT